MIKGLHGYFVLHYAHAFASRVFKRLGLIKQSATLDDQGLDRIAAFDEYPSCELCGSRNNHEVFVCMDQNRIVECDSCGLWFTSPRIVEATWSAWLRQDSERSRIFTENRLTYGVGLPSNIRYAYPNWRAKRIEKERQTIKSLLPHVQGECKRLHDVGCGAGLLLSAAKEMGIDATGNDLNGYACKVMNERLGLKVFNATVSETGLPDGSIDTITMCDYIEHTYHPLADFQTAFRLLRPGGAIYVETFHLECRDFDRHGSSWNMLYWNHTFHFTCKTLSAMLEKAGFEIRKVICSADSNKIAIFAAKAP